MKGRPVGAHPIRIAGPGARGPGYRVCVESRRPAAGTCDVWLPGLAPSRALAGALASGELAWTEFARRYRTELAVPAAQNLLKPLSLLSLRRRLVLVCSIGWARRVPARILAAALRECRTRGRFALEFRLRRALACFALAVLVLTAPASGVEAERSLPEDWGPAEIDVSDYPSDHQATYREVFLPVFALLRETARVVNSPLVELDASREAAERRAHPDLFADPRVAEPSRDGWRRRIEDLLRRPPCCGSCPALGRRKAQALWRFLVYDSLARKTGANAAAWIAHRRALFAARDRAESRKEAVP